MAIFHKTFFNAISKSEDEKGVPLLIVPLSDDLVFFDIIFLNIAGG